MRVTGAPSFFSTLAGGRSAIVSAFAAQAANASSPAKGADASSRGATRGPPSGPALRSGSYSSGLDLWRAVLAAAPPVSSVDAAISPAGVPASSAPQSALAAAARVIRKELSGAPANADAGALSTGNAAVVGRSPDAATASSFAPRATALSMSQALAAYAAIVADRVA